MRVEHLIFLLLLITSSCSDPNNTNYVFTNEDHSLVEFIQDCIEYHKGHSGSQYPGVFMLRKSTICDEEFFELMHISHQLAFKSETFNPIYLAQVDSSLVFICFSSFANSEIEPLDKKEIRDAAVAYLPAISEPPITGFGDHFFFRKGPVSDPAKYFNAVDTLFKYKNQDSNFLHQKLFNYLHLDCW